VAEGRDPQPQARHDLAVIGACIAADRARQTGRRVEIDDR
jgi:hypothetical protein